MEHPQLGPIGGLGGKPFDGYAIPDGARLTAVHIYADWVIDALQFDYVNIDGATAGRPPVGGLGGTHHVIYLDEDEYLIGISGRCGWYVDSIRFHTNKRVSDLFGGSAGEREYRLMALPGYEVAGLFGRSDWYIDALGLTLRPLALREEMAEGLALATEAEAELSAEQAEEDLDAAIDALADELAAAGAARQTGPEALAEAPDDLRGESVAPEAREALEAAVLADIVAALEEEIDAELRAEAGEELLDEAATLTDDALDQVIVALAADIESTEDLESLEAQAALRAIAELEDMEPGDEATVDLRLARRVNIDPVTGRAHALVTAAATEIEDELSVEDGDGWLELDDDAEPIEALVIVRREAVNSDEALAALEERVVAEAIAALRAGQADEGTVDVTVYTQVGDTAESGLAMATVIAVVMDEAPAEEDGPEAAVMVTDAIDGEHEVALLEEEAVEGAVAALEEDLGRVLYDADIAIYAGVTRDEAGQLFGAVVAVATPSEPEESRPGEPEGALLEAPPLPETGSRGEAVIQLTGTEPRPSDLQIVEGIGPKIAAILIDHGIYDLGALARTPVERLRDILAASGARFRLADPQTWPQQAELAAAGDWAALTDLQTRLKGGRQ